MCQTGDITIRLHGTPQPAGSKRGFVNPRSGRVIITDANSKSRDWKNQVAQAAGEQYDGDLLEGALSMTIVVYRPRPTGHFGTGRNQGVVKNSAPRYPVSRPDLLKLARGIEDALTNVVYRDDSQIVDEFLLKRYGPAAYVEVTIRRVVDDVLHDDASRAVLGAGVREAPPVEWDVQRSLWSVPPVGDDRPHGVPAAA